MFTLYSNLTRLGSYDTQAAAFESYRYDDIVMLERDGLVTHFAKAGALYRAQLMPSRKTTAARS